MINKVAIIVGATSGIGRETALLFSKHKIKVVVAGRNVLEGNLLVTEITNKGGDAIFVKTDVTNPLSIKNLMSTSLKQYGKIDIAFNNAGIEGKSQHISVMDEENWDNVINTNLKGVWLCLKHEFSALKSNGGVIINTSTCLTHLGLETTAAYASSKSGVDALTKVAAVEYGPYGIRVNAINPGAVNTPMLQRIYTAEQISDMKETNPLKKIASPRDIAETVLWLCSPMANHINGACILIDGGSTLN